MKKSICIIAILLGFIVSTNAQKTFKPFIINGTVNSDLGVIKLVPIDEEYYDKQSICNSSTIKKGKFVFKGLIDCPTGFRLRLEINSELKSMSDIFYVFPGSQHLICDMQTAWNLPEISNSLMEDQNKLFDPFSHSYENMLSRDSILLLYTKKNPNSYLNLWKLIDNMAVGYKAIYDSIFMILPNEIKSCYAGKVLAKKLQSCRILTFGNKFPDMSLLSTSMKPITISSKSNGYTLYDFWFSHCIPCISQFPELKKIYAEYHQMGFNIIGILSDNIENVEEWKSIIKNKELKWEHYLDLNLKKANEFSIKKFPTNYLMDKNGLIIAKDLRPEELSSFLKSHINQLKD